MKPQPSTLALADVFPSDGNFNPSHAMNAPLADKPTMTELLAAEEEVLTPLQVQKILVPTDLSPPAAKAVRYASLLARQFGGEVTLLHVIEPIYPYPLDGAPPYPVATPMDPNLARRAELEELLEQEGVAAATEHQVVVNTAVRIGSAYQQIVGAARELETDLIVIPTHGYTGLKHFLLGSTAEKVVRHAPCPVLVVREKEREFA